MNKKYRFVENRSQHIFITNSLIRVSLKTLTLLHSRGLFDSLFGSKCIWE